MVERFKFTYCRCHIPTGISAREEHYTAEPLNRCEQLELLNAWNRTSGVRWKFYLPEQE